MVEHCDFCNDYGVVVCILDPQTSTPGFYLREEAKQLNFLDLGTELACPMCER